MSPPPPPPPSAPPNNDFDNLPIPGGQVSHETTRKLQCPRGRGGCSMTFGKTSQCRWRTSGCKWNPYIPVVSPPPPPGRSTLEHLHNTPFKLWENQPMAQQDCFDFSGYCWFIRLIEGEKPTFLGCLGRSMTISPEPLQRDSGCRVADNRRHSQRARDPVTHTLSSAGSSPTAVEQLFWTPTNFF